MKKRASFRNPIPRRFRWHRAAARAAVAARLDDYDPSAFFRFPHALGVVGEGVLSPAEVAPLETLLPPQFAWILSPFVWMATTCQPSRWPISRKSMRWFKRRLVSRVWEGAGIRMGARLSALADSDAARVIARATATATAAAAAADDEDDEDTGDDDAVTRVKLSAPSYIIVARSAGNEAGMSNVIYFQSTFKP